MRLSQMCMKGYDILIATFQSIVRLIKCINDFNPTLSNQQISTCFSHLRFEMKNYMIWYQLDPRKEMCAHNRDLN
jgi:hypothetical protein